MFFRFNFYLQDFLCGSVFLSLDDKNHDGHTEIVVDIYSCIVQSLYILCTVYFYVCITKLLYFIAYLHSFFRTQWFLVSALPLKSNINERKNTNLQYFNRYTLLFMLSKTKCALSLRVQYKCSYVYTEMSTFYIVKASSNIQANLETNKANLETSKANLETNKANLETNKANLQTNKANMETNKANMETNKAYF